MPANPVSGVKKKNKGSSRQLEEESCGNDELTKRRKHALKIVSDAISRGAQTFNADQVSLILKEYCEEYGLPGKSFDFLDREARLEIALEVRAGHSVPTREEIERASPRTAIQFGQTTPRSSRDGKTKSIQASEALRLTEADNGPIEPVETDASTDLVLHHPETTKAKLVSGYRYKCRMSYISRVVIVRYNIKDDGRVPGSVRLEWREASAKGGGKKTKESRFWIVDDDKIEHDLAIGKDCDVVEPPLEDGDGCGSSEEDEDAGEFEDKQDDLNDNYSRAATSESSSASSDNGSAVPIGGTGSEERRNPVTNYVAPNVDCITAQDNKLMGELIGAASLYIVANGKRTRSNAADAAIPVFNPSKPALGPQKSPRISGGRETPSRPSEEESVRSSRKSDTSRNDSLKDRASSKSRGRKKRVHGKVSHQALREDAI